MFFHFPRNRRYRKGRIKRLFYLLFSLIRNFQLLNLPMYPATFAIRILCYTFNHIFIYYICRALNSTFLTKHCVLVTAYYAPSDCLVLNKVKVFSSHHMLFVPLAPLAYAKKLKSLIKAVSQGERHYTVCVTEVRSH